MGRYKFEQRISELEACAKSLQWNFNREDETGLIKLMLDFKLFKRGHRKKICPIIIMDKGDLEYTCVFDYSYTISTNNSSNGKKKKYPLKTAVGDHSSGKGKKQLISLKLTAKEFHRKWLHKSHWKK